MKEKPIYLILPNDPATKEKLEGKLNDYKKRIGESIKQNPGIAPEAIFCTDAGYKAAIVERLFDKGLVNLSEFAKELKRKYGFINTEDYNNAAGVIDDYCTTGGKNTTGGTGF